MKHNLISVSLLLLFNTAIAALLTIIEFGMGFWINWVFSQCIGGCIALVNTPLIPRIAPGWKRWATLLATLPISVMLGSALAHGLLGLPLELSPQFWQSVAIGMMFAVIGSIVFLLAERIHQLDSEVRQRRLAEAEQARRETDARLKLLQAQIEPHFLFNTLANVGSLIDSDPPRARILLDRLNDWLRVALVRARSEQATLGDELSLLENWLEILTERFGARLTWEIDADAATRALPFPPMLLQPLVENAVKHGIEPKVGGGTVNIATRLVDGLLRIVVSDNGASFQAEPTKQGAGAGLDNVRTRLAALYGDSGRLDLRTNAAGGVTATLELPCAH
jgi:LytS/YehU family sensor histidine kinase